MCVTALLYLHIHTAGNYNDDSSNIVDVFVEGGGDANVVADCDEDASLVDYCFEFNDGGDDEAGEEDEEVATVNIDVNAPG